MRLSTYLLGIPTAAIAVVVALANRGAVIVSLDPTSAANPAIAAQMPLFVALFIAFGIGIFVGALAAYWSRRKRD